MGREPTRSLRPPRLQPERFIRGGVAATSAALLAVALAGAPSAAAVIRVPSTHSLVSTVHTDDFQGISCVASKGCLAVGVYSKAGKSYALAETRSAGASTWVLHDPAVIPGATGAGFGAIGTGESVRCVSSPSPVCIAVGSYSNAAGEHNFAAEWNWSTWKIVNPPNPSASSSLDALSCRSSDFCVAVGQWYDVAANKVELESQIWNGSSWTIKSVPPLQAGATNPSLDGISCVSTTYCMAVGDYDVGNTGSQPSLSEVWNGSSWTIHLPPNPSGTTGNALSGVSCESTSFCNAVGESLPTKGAIRSLGEEWGGKSWTIKATPAGKQSVGSVLYDVSCVSTSFCLSSGTLAARWSGSAWLSEALPTPKGSIETNAAAVSCLSPTDCTAAGDYRLSITTSDTLVLNWNGTAFKQQIAQNP
jgi:hypothetical protein